jgi:DNA polymerase I-like protein with 3'-5' exonuclease and polymerase domains
MYKPTFVVADFETALLDGSPSVKFYRPDFRVTTCGFGWYDKDGNVKTVCKEGEDEVKAFLVKCQSQNIPLVCHHLGFERGVTQCRFPGLEDLFQIDTMRLAQQADNGGPDGYESTYEEEMAELDGRKHSNGLGLEACASRFLTAEFFKHKQPYLDLITARGGKKGDFHLLTKEELVAYNLKDVETTLALYTTLIEKLRAANIDWHKDHMLYRSRVKQVVNARIEGVKVDLEQAAFHIELEEQNILKINTEFREKYKEHIDAIEQSKIDSWVLSSKSPNTQAKRRQSVEESGIPEDCRFNLGSGKDKANLFVGRLGLEPKFKSPTGAPSFNAKLLWQYGEPGLLLTKLGTHKIAKIQTETLRDMAAEYDGRWHIDMKCASTRNGRMSGGGGLNVQGMSRRNADQQKCIVADEGYVFISSDAGAGEPTVTAHYSRDPNYLAATFDMIGKRPYYNSEGLLMIGDIYLMVASKFPKWIESVRYAFESRWTKSLDDKGKSVWIKSEDGIQGYDLWVEDPDAIAKGILKKIRGYAKPLCLGIAYSMGASKMCLIAQQNGFSLTSSEARSFRDLYWDIFKMVKALESKLTNLYQQDGVLVNDFGYALHPNSPHKILNSFIQSNVAGIMDLLTMLFFEKCPEARYVVNIHDEIVFQVPVDKIEHCKEIYYKCVDELNTLLGWSVNLRFGWDESTTWSIGK